MEETDELPCECGGELMLMYDFGETCGFTCNTCNVTFWVEYS